MAEKLGEAFVELVISDKKFQAAIKDAQNRTISAATGMQKSFNSLNMERANKAVEKFVGIALKATAAIGVGMVGAIALSVKRFASFEKEMVNVSTLVDTSKVSMEKLKKGIMELPPELGSATENAAALYQTLSAGVKPAQAIKFLGDAAMAAKAGLTSTFTAVDAGTTILNAFGMESKDAMIIFDQMFKTVELGKITFEGLSSNVGKIVPIFQAAGLATEQMFGALAELTKGGMDVAQASSRLAVTVGAIVKPSSEAAKMAEELGIEFNAAALRAKGLSTFMKELTIATGGSIEKMAMFFGGVESLTIALSLAKNEGIGFAESSKAIADSAGAVKVAFDKQKETLSVLWDTFKVTIEKQAILLGGTLAPVLKDIVGDMNDWLNANRDLIATKIVSFANELATAIKGIADAWKSNQSSLKVLYEGIETATRWTVLWAESMGYVAGKASIALEKFQQLGREQKKQPQMGILPPGKVKLDEVFGGGSSGKLSGGGGGFEKSFGLPSLSYMDLYVNEIKSNNDKIVKIRKEGFDASLIDAGQYYQEIESYDIDAYTAQMENIKEIQTSWDDAFGEITTGAKAGATNSLTAFEEFRNGVQSGLKEITGGWFSWTTFAKDAVITMANVSSNAISNTLFNTIKGEMTSFKDVWESFTDSLLRTFTDMIAQMAIKWAAQTFLGINFPGTTTTATPTSSGFISSIVGNIPVVGPILSKVVSPVKSLIEKIPIVGGFLSSIFHQGGIVGQDGMPRLVPAMAFTGAPKAHSGLGPDERPIIAKKGEGVFTPEQMAAMGGSGEIHIHVEIDGREIAHAIAPQMRGNFELTDAIDQRIRAVTA